MREFTVESDSVTMTAIRNCGPKRDQILKSNACMEQMDLPRYITFLMNADSYPHRVDATALIQTHISFVVLAGDYVYKWKKPVNFGFLDFSTLAKRKFFCEQELILNRRLCPELYLDVVSVNQDGDRYSLDGPGQPVEYGVKMVRMPEEKMMQKVIAQNGLTREHLEGIIAMLIPFYKAAEATRAIGEFGRAEAVAKNVVENFEQAEFFIGKGVLSRDIFATIKDYALKVLADSKRFDRRVRAGRIRDCHGDLYSANICLADKVLIFDCIEFNERFRYSDVAADIAFLAMDLDFYNLTDLSAFFVTRFAAESGDDSLADVLDFYKCYRAFVRGKVGLFTAADPAVDSRTKQRCLEEARRYFQLAVRYAEGR